MLGSDFDFDAFHNFDAFLNTMGLNAPLDCIFPDLLTGYDSVFGDSSLMQPSNDSDMPCLPPDAEAEDIHELKRIPCVWKVTSKQRDNLCASIQPYKQHVAGFTLPSALAVSRYITGYFEDFHNHLQMLHEVTYRPQDCPDSPELVMAICAIGAVCRWERHVAVQFFKAAKTIVHARWTQRHQRSPVIDPSRGGEADSGSELRTIQAATLLAAFAVMDGNSETIHEAASLHGLLVDYVGEEDDHEASRTAHTSWTEWMLCESKRRAECAIFNVLNLYTTVLDKSPALPGSRLNTYLPCSTLEWTAQNESDWIAARAVAPQPVHFQQAYSALFSATAPQTHLHSPFGNLVLINALLQRIYLARQMQVDINSELVRSTDLGEIEVALERWAHAWKQAPESILDPRNPDASNSFTSTSLLGLAFVRLYTPYAACRRLCESQPKKTGAHLSRAPNPQRITRATPALLHVTHAFAIPVKYGMEYTGRRQFHHWDLQNFIWHLEAATFLSKWLMNVAESCHFDPLSTFESRMMSIIRSLVDKAEESLGHSKPNETIDDTSTLARNISGRLTRLWVCVYRKHNSPWGLSDLIGESLLEYDRAMAGR